MQIDEEFKNLIPRLGDEEFRQLEENIIVEGCRDALITWNNILIDGHNRYEICKKNGIDFRTIEKTFSNREEVKMWIIKNQFGRRNLSKYDRSLLALKLEDMYREKAKENQGKRTDLFHEREKSSIMPINTTKELAQIAGVSINTMNKVNQIQKQGTDIIKNAVKDKEVSINKGYEIVKTASKVPEEQREEKEAELVHQYLNEQFREIERIKGTEIRMHDAIFKILTVEINEENVQIWLDGLDEYERNSMDNRLNEIKEKYEFIKEMWENHNRIRRIK